MICKRININKTQKVWESCCLPFHVDNVLPSRQFPPKIIFIKCASETEQGRLWYTLDFQMQVDVLTNKHLRCVF